MTEVICKIAKCIYNCDEHCQRTSIVLNDLQFPTAAVAECLSAEYRKEKADEATKEADPATKVTII
jgi:hypothetical protein